MATPWAVLALTASKTPLPVRVDSARAVIISPEHDLVVGWWPTAITILVFSFSSGRRLRTFPIRAVDVCFGPDFDRLLVSQSSEAILDLRVSDGSLVRTISDTDDTYPWAATLSCSRQLILTYKEVYKHAAVYSWRDGVMLFQVSLNWLPCLLSAELWARQPRYGISAYDLSCVPASSRCVTREGNTERYHYWRLRATRLGVLMVTQPHFGEVLQLRSLDKRGRPAPILLDDADAECFSFVQVVGDDGSVLYVQHTNDMFHRRFVLHYSVALRVSWVFCVCVYAPR